MAGTKEIKRPADLYKLPHEQELSDEQREFLLSPTTVEEMEMIKKLTTSN